MKTITGICTLLLALSSGGALAGHCDNELAEAEWALDNATDLEPNVVEAAEALISDALDACDGEEEQLLIEGFGSPLSDPTYVSIGQSMLINARDLANGL